MGDRNDKKIECLIIIFFYEWHLLIFVKKKPVIIILSTLLLQMKFTSRGAVPLRTRKTITLQCWAWESWCRWQIYCVLLELKLTRVWTICRLRTVFIRRVLEIRCSLIPLNPIFPVRSILWNGSKRAGMERLTCTLEIVSSPGNKKIIIIF